MGINIADIVISISGRDINELFVVIDKDENFLYLVNGKNRKLSNPKKKKIKHIKFFENGEMRVLDKIKANEKITNSEIRRVLIDIKKSTDMEVDNLGER